MLFHIYQEKLNIYIEDGKLYTFGSGNWGPLGHGSEKDVKFDNP